MFGLFQSDQHKIDQCISDFPGPLYLRASRAKWWMVIAMGSLSAVVPACLATIFYLHPERVVNGEATGIVIMISLTILFGSTTFVVSRKGLRGSLQLDREGFLAIGIRREQYRWREVSDFNVNYYRTKCVVFASLTEEPRLIGAAWWPGNPPTTDYIPPKAEFNSFSAVRDKLVPDTYGFSAEDLASLMNEWRKLAIQK